MSYGPSARGEVMARLTAEMISTEAQDENCLVLNVWAPVGRPATPRPVMVSVHGGAHTVGSSSLPVFDGAYLAEAHDVVVVTVNHRLGALGYLYLGELFGEEYATSGNVGTLDLVAALRWVRDNIAGFGGDPGNVTMFGESGGGSKTCTLLAMPSAAGLFHRAIVQSGPKTIALSTEVSTATALAMLDALGIAPPDARQLLTVPVDQLVAAQLEVLGGPLGGAVSGGRTLGPVLDGIALDRLPFEPDAPAVSASVPLLIGTTKDEMTFFTYANEALDTLDDAGGAAVMRQLFGEHADVLYGTYRTTRPGATPVQLVTAGMTDGFRIPSIRIAERKAALGQAPVWMYRFDYETDVLDGRLGAPHAIDVAYSFGIPDASQLSGSRADRHQVAEQVSSAWASFARHGNPQTDSLGAWPAYDTRQRATMIFDSTCRVAEDPDSQERQAWEGIDLPR